RELGRAGWAGQQTTGCGTRRTFDLVGGAIIFVSFAWFALHLLLTLASLDPRIRPLPIQDVIHLLLFLFPPLIIHTTSVEAPAAGRPLPKGTGLPVIGGVYLVSQFVSWFTLLGYFRVVRLAPGVPDLVTNASCAVLFILAGVYSAAVVHATRQVTESTEQ